MSAVTWYAYYQLSGEDAWIPMLAASRDQTVKDKQPRYSTVLDVNTNITHDTERADLDKLAYRGDLYIDIDVSKEMGGIETAIVQINTLLDKYGKLGVDLGTLRIFASGSKGFHLEIPTETFLDKVPRLGTPHLPVIYKEVVHAPELYVDGIDNRVYSAGRGRMWRSTNVQRENGRYKVAITLEECRGLTTELYDEYVTAPRPLPVVAAPVYCSALAVMYATAVDTVTARRKRVMKSKVDPVTIARWAKKPPGELQMVLNGKTKEGAGFHPIAIQVALAAMSLGWSVDEMLERAETLIENHRGDGNRYDSPRKRQRELTRLWYYYQGGSGTYYEFAMTPIRALLDVQGAAMAAQPDWDAEAMNAADEEEEAAEAADPNDALLTAGVKLRRQGLFKMVEKGLARASAVGFDNVVQLIDLESGDTSGYQADMYLDGRSLGNKVMNMSLFTSRQNLQGFALANGGASLHLNDAQVVGLAEIFRKKAMKTDNTVYHVNREGLDFMRQTSGNIHALYVSHEEFFQNSGEDEGKQYALKPASGDAHPVKSDILHAPELSGSEDERDLLTNLLHVNKPETVGKLLGWMAAAFVSQAIRLEFRQFPSLHVYGAAGSGKSATCELFANLHYYRKDVESEGIGGVSGHAMKTRLSSTASIPVIWDEYKPHMMRDYVLKDAQQYIRNNYRATKNQNGTVRRDTGISHLDLRNYRNCAPLAFIGETVETETAIAERYVLVPMTKKDKSGLADEFAHCRANRHILGHLGKSLISEGLNLDHAAMKTSIEGYMKIVGETIAGVSVSDDTRRIFNYAVALYGLDLALSAIEPKFSGEFGETFQRLKDGVLSSIRGSLPRNMSESSKVLDSMAFLSKGDTDDDFKLTFGQDYTCTNHSVDIKLRTAFNRYLRHSRAHGIAPLFPIYDKFRAAMEMHPAMIDNMCLDNDTLKDTVQVDVFRFSTDGLSREGIELFRGQLGALK